MSERATISSSDDEVEVQPEESQTTKRMPMTPSASQSTKKRPLEAETETPGSKKKITSS
jgi:hypothetical protein